MHNFHILYLDNDRILADQVKMHLEWQGYKVVITNTEETLLTKIRQQAYDLLIIDLLTPVPNAFSLLEHLSKQKILPPTIVVSDEMDHHQANKVMHFGCINYVLKNSLFQKFFEQLSLSIFQASEERQQCSQQLDNIITHNTPPNMLVWEYDPLQEIVHWSPEKSEKLISLPYDEFTTNIHLEDLAHVKTQNNICLFSHKPVEYSFRYLSDSNHIVTYQAHISAEVDNTGVVNRLYGNIQTLSPEQHNDNNLHLKLSFLDNTADGVFITDTHNQVISVNKAFTTISGYTEQEIIKQNTDILNAAHFNSDFFKKVIKKLKNDDFWQGEVLIRHRDGHIVPIWQSSHILKDASGNIAQSISVLRDISQQKAQQESIQFQANYDLLTELPNRTLFLDRLKSALKLTKRNNTKLALMLLDLNKFKWINDTLGHHAGDLLLQETAKKLQAAVRNSDTVARLGGDEFSIIIPDLEKTTDAELIVSKIFKAFKQPLLIDQQEIFISGSIGITIFPDDGDDINSLQKNADSAMYIAKKNGQNSYYYYTHALQRETENRLKLINDMRLAMQNQEFSLHYQPIIDLFTNKVVGAEALLRWNHEQEGYIPLNDFIPIAEESGLIREVGNWVINEVADNIQRWTDLGLPALHISLNQSIAQYSLSDCHIEWLDILKNKQIPAGSITFEIAEKLFFEQKGSHLESIKKLKQAGIQVSLDSFGTGYSSLNYLKDYPIDVLKIDRSYIHTMLNDSTNAILVETIIILAHKLGIKVIATGVENKEQLALLNQECRYAQGFYFSKPLPFNEFKKYIGRQHPASTKELT